MLEGIETRGHQNGVSVALCTLSFSATFLVQGVASGDVCVTLLEVSVTFVALRSM